jgi:C4-dicarboxylate-specific signal transduction histidine kinase
VTTAGQNGAAAAEELRLLELQFVGEVLAVFVHETNNRLATLQETVGLLGDVMNAPGAGKTTGLRESLRVAAGLEGQIALLAELVRQLDAFARRVASPAGGVELPAALAELLDLTSRLARQKGTRVERDFDGRLPALAVEPAAFLLLCFRLLARALEAPPQGTVRLLVRGRGPESGVGVAVPGRAGAVGLVDETARGLVRRLGGRIEEGQATDTVMIWFPSPT